jgi:hypothetical protein
MKKKPLLFAVIFLTVSSAFVATAEPGQEQPSDLQNSSAPPANRSAIPGSGAGASTQDSGKLQIILAPFYLWMTGLNGNVGVKGYVVPVNASFADVFSNLNIGYMGALELRKQSFGSLLDLEYTNLTTQEASTPFGLLYSSARTRAKTFFIDPEFYGRVVDNPKYSIDALAGVRVWRLDNGIDLRAGLLPALSLDDTQSWADPLLGARFRTNLPKGFFATLKGDAGVGGNETWQIYTGGGKTFRQKYALILAYRRLDIHYRTSGFLYDTSMNGLLLGMTIRLR